VEEADEPLPDGREPGDEKDEPGPAPVPHPISNIPVAATRHAPIPCRDFVQRITLLG
jgi:hypothetical protein